MEFIVIPAYYMTSVPQKTLDELGLSPRYSIDETQAIIHLEIYKQLFPQMLRSGETSYPVYTNPSKELSDLLESPEWNKPIE